MNRFTPPSDKSITIRTLLLGAIAQGRSEIKNPLISQDTAATVACLKALGVKITKRPNGFAVEGRGLKGLKAPSAPLNTGESGALSRMLAGILCGQDFSSVVTGRGSLMKRPMAKITSELAEMGARIETKDGKLPLTIKPSALRGARASQVESAQLKSSLLLAGLYASGPSRITEKLPSRDHSERLLGAMGARVKSASRTVTLRPGPLTAIPVTVPGDISSAAFFVAAALLSGRPLRIVHCGLNPTRLGFITTLKKMGARISFKTSIRTPEPVGELTVRPSALRGVRVKASEIPGMIDEIPLLAVIAASARGVTVISGIEGLRAKESDRVESTLALLRALGAEADYGEKGMVIRGGRAFSCTGPVETFSDHRIAMSAAVASLACPGLEIRDPGCVSKSYPGFWKDFRKVFNRRPARRPGNTPGKGRFSAA